MFLFIDPLISCRSWFYTSNRMYVIEESAGLILRYDNIESVKLKRSFVKNVPELSMCTQKNVLRQARQLSKKRLLSSRSYNMPSDGISVKWVSFLYSRADTLYISSTTVQHPFQCKKYTIATFRLQWLEHKKHTEYSDNKGDGKSNNN